MGAFDFVKKMLGSKAEEAMAIDQRNQLNQRDEPKMTNLDDEGTPDYQLRTGEEGDIIDRFSRLLPYTAFDADRNLFVIESNKPGIPEGLGFVMELNMQLGGGDDLVNGLTDALSQVAKPGYGIQFHVYGSPDLEWYFKNILETTLKGTAKFLTDDAELGVMRKKLFDNVAIADRLKVDLDEILGNGAQAKDMLERIAEERMNNPGQKVILMRDEHTSMSEDESDYQIEVVLPEMVKKAEVVQQEYREATYQVDKMREKVAEAERRNEQRRLLIKMAEARVAHYRRLATEDVFDQLAWRARNVRAFVSGVIPTKNLDDVALREASMTRDALKVALSAFGMHAYDWESYDLIAFCSQIFNMQQTLRNEMLIPAYDDGKEIRSQVISTETFFAITPDHIELEDSRCEEPMCVRALSPRTYPSQFQLNSMGSLLGALSGNNVAYPCPYMITTGISYQDFDSRKNVVMAKAARAQQTADSDIARYMPGVNEVNEDWKTLQRSFDDGKGDCKMYHQVLLFAPASEIARAEQAAKAVWRQERFELAVDTMMQHQGLLCSMPMFNGPLMQSDMKNAMRSSTKTAWNAGNMVPVIGEFYGTPPRDGEQKSRGVLSLFGRRGQAMTYDIFANNAGNYNGCVVGASGSGKSALLNEMITRTLANGGRVWVIDAGRSYEKQVQMMGGQYLEFKAANNICVNPFSLIDDIDSDMEMIKPVIAQMVAPTRQLTDYESAQLELHITSIWQDSALDGRLPTITTLANSLKNNCSMGGPNPQAGDSDSQKDWNAKLQRMTMEERSKFCDPRIRDLGVQLFPFTEDGSHGKWFNGPANLRLSSNFIVLELEELNSKRDLRAVILMLIMYEITREMYRGERSQDKLVIIDEAWDLMSDGQTGSFIESGYRRARKYGGSFFTATQGIDDYYKSEISKAAFMNADCMFLLRQKQESFAALEKSGRLATDEQTKQMMRSVTTVHGKYSEIFVKIGDFPPAVGRLFFDPFSLLAVSTKAEDFEAVQTQVKQGIPTEEAIEIVLNERKARKQQMRNGQ